LTGSWQTRSLRIRNWSWNFWKNVSPWQSALQRAKWSLVGAAASFAMALFLWKVLAPKLAASTAGAPYVPYVLVAAGIAAAVGAAMLINAFVVANQIEDKYGQKLQRDSVYDQGLRRSSQGKQLERGPSSLEDASKLRNHGGKNGNFGY